MSQVWMHERALDQAERAFESAEDPEIRSLVPRIAVYQARMEPLAYDCIGCKKCWGADAIIELANNFDEVELDICGNKDEHSSGGIQSAIGSSNSSASLSAIAAWPPPSGRLYRGQPCGYSGHLHAFKSRSACSSYYRRRTVYSNCGSL